MDRAVTEPLAALVVQPGDRVLVALGESVTAERARRIAKGLQRHFPDVEFAIVDGVTALAKMPARQDSDVLSAELPHMQLQGDDEEGAQ